MCVRLKDSAREHDRARTESVVEGDDDVVCEHGGEQGDGPLGAVLAVDAEFVGLE